MALKRKKHRHIRTCYYHFEKGDKVRGSWDTATVIQGGCGRDTSILIEWDDVDAANVYRGPGRLCWRKSWTLTKI